MLAAIVKLQDKTTQRHEDYERVDDTLYATKADGTAKRKQKQRVDDDFKKSPCEIGGRAGLVTVGLDFRKRHGRSVVQDRQLGGI